MRSGLFTTGTLMLIVLAVTLACSKINQLVSPQSARQKYLQSLKEADLLQREPVAEWERNFEEALQSPQKVDLPYSEQILIPVGETRADGFLIDIPAGRKVRVEVQRQSGRGNLFLEVRSAQNPTETVAYTDTAVVSIEPASEARQVILILQPELMAFGKWNFNISTLPSLQFPVKGRSDTNVGSIFGDSRDNGRRKHHGIDIFAPRGTPVVAVQPGWIYRTGNTGLGGKNVWLNGAAGNIYYAHLDSIAVSAPLRVKTGDTLGFVGNTGNARYTPPHLHFGIYKSGPVDPWPFVRQAQHPQQIEPLIFEVATAKATTNSNFRTGPGTNHRKIATLQAETPIWILGQTGNWVRVRSEVGRGYIHRSLVAPENPGDLKVEFYTPFREKADSLIP